MPFLPLALDTPWMWLLRSLTVLLLLRLDLIMFMPMELDFFLMLITRSRTIIVRQETGKLLRELTA